ncbi:MAG TPA: hypothetical protein VGO80_12480 [Solirubrobacteraceae bacterium]|nr:hypothetical protein [Solirubrobacteraceae bacterium]
MRGTQRRVPVRRALARRLRRDLRPALQPPAPRGLDLGDAAGLPILPGLARYGEVAKGSIDHTLRFTARRTRRAYVYLARHFASSDSDPALPPMGLRVRLKRGASLAGLGPQTRVVARTRQRYGALPAARRGASPEPPDRR